MSNSPLIHAIQNRLRVAGYSDLATPFKVAGVEFSFTGAMRGREGRALDLVLLVDATTGDFGDQDGSRVRQRIEALSRALDVTDSRYVVTTIFAGAVSADIIEALSETCRVLQVEDIPLNDHYELENEAAELMLDDRIRLLLPLILPHVPSETPDGNGRAMEQFINAIPSETGRDLVEAVTNASNGGDQAVTDAIASIINGAFQLRQGDEPA